VTIRLVPPQTSDDWRSARRLIEEYAASLDLDLSFQNIAHELDHLDSEYAPPTGAFLLADAEGAWVGCVGVRRFAEGVGEIKRLYVGPAARGLGVGKLLARAIIADGKRLGYPRLLLDTLPSMKGAIALYQALGFRQTAAYRFNPEPGTLYFELVIADA
jgi:putative acetyltransferase